MVLDIIALALAIIALFKGLSKGFIAALFAIISVVVALAAALKLSAMVAAAWGASMQVEARWLPVLSFLLVFIVAMFTVRILAKMIEKGFEWAMLGWVNKLAGVLLYCLLYGLLYSTFLFFVNGVGLLSEAQLTRSVVYPHLKNWAPRFFDYISVLLPFLQGVFSQLQEFFEKMAETAAPTTVMVH